MNRHSLLLVVLLLIVCSPALLRAEDALAKYSAKVWKDTEGEALNYRFRAPERVEPGQRYPLVVFFHGAGGRGDDNAGQLKDAGALEAFEKAGLFSKRSAYLVAGQVPRGEQWVDVPWSTLDHRMPKVSRSMRLMLEVVDAVVADPENQVDSGRIYAMGLSMGGYATWDAIQRRPAFFAAAVPICGGGDQQLGKAIAQVPVWAWHGDKDGVIKPSRSRDMIEAMKKAGGSPKYTELPGVGHNAWSAAWASPDLWEWLFAQKRR